MMPPSPRGSVQEQLVRQYSYLFQMAQQLNVALGQLESGGTAAPSGGTAAPAAEREQQYQTLKSMIVKTADTVQRRMDQLSARLEGEYPCLCDLYSGDCAGHVDDLRRQVRRQQQL